MEKLKLVKISDIKVSRNFRNSVPSPEKMNRYRDAYCLGKDSKHSYEKCAGQVKPIILNENNMIVDGYIQYLVMKEMDEEYCYCCVEHKLVVYTLIDGVHTNGNSKEYTWRVPDNTNWNEFKSKISYGDLIWVRTSNGISPIIGTNITTIEAIEGELSGLERIAKKDIMKGELWKSIEIDEKVLIKNSVSEEWIPAHYAGLTYDKKDDILHSGPLCAAGPVSGIVGLCRKFLHITLVLFGGDSGVAHIPFAASGDGIEAPMQEHTKTRILKPLYSFFSFCHIGFVLSQRPQMQAEWQLDAALYGSIISFCAFQHNTEIRVIQRRVSSRYS